MKYIIKRNISYPTLRVINNIVIEVNKEFEILTGYKKEELIGKTINEINNLLMTDLYSQLKLDNQNDCYIFTKKQEPREVVVNCKSNASNNEITFFIKEKRNFRIEDRLTYIMSIMQDKEKGFAIYSVPNLLLLKANQKYLDISVKLFKKADNYVGASIKDLLPEYRGSDFEKLIFDLIRTGEKYDAKEIKISMPKTGNIYLDISLVPVIIDGNAKFIVNSLVDVTENVVMRKILEEQKYELEAIIENMSDELIIFTESGRYIKLNKAARSNPILNYKTIKNLKKFEENNTFYDKKGNIIPTENLPFKRILKGERVKNLRIDNYNDKEVLHYELNGIPIQDNFGNFIAGVIVLRDIRERLKHDENLYIKAHYDSLRSIVENLDMGFSRLSYPELNYIDINNKSYNLLKKLSPELGSHSSVIGLSLLDVYKSDNNLLDSLKNAVKDNLNVYSKIVKYNIDGKQIFNKYFFQPLFGLEKNIIEIIITWIDVTEEINSKIEMENSLKIQDEIYSNISHELKTPLNVIYSANQMMDIYLNKSFEENKDKVLQYNKSIRQNCFRLIKLINNIVDLSKINSGFLKYNPSNVNIVEIIENIVLSIAEYVKSKQLNIIFDTDIEEKIIACDVEKIERIMLNLISNAIKFSYAGNDIYINVYDKGEYLEVDIKDTGIGIEKKYLDSIFKRFFQEDKSLSRNAEGSGIGLYLVKEFVEMHDGKINVESEVGKGSTFKIELPAKIIENSYNTENKLITENKFINNKIDIIRVELSDIYS